MGSPGGSTEGQAAGKGRIMRGRIRIEANDQRFLRLLAAALARPPPSVPRIRSVRTITLTSRSTKTTVGITRSKIAEGIEGPAVRQTLTFYSELLDRLSDRAALGVIAHEIAHAWLNEHANPEQSKAREAEADQLARSWGFGEELDALDNEAETV